MSTAHQGWAVAGGLLAVAIAAATTYSAHLHAPVAVAASSTGAPAVVAGTSPSAAPTPAPGALPPASASSAAAGAAAEAGARALAAAQAASGTAAPGGAAGPQAMTAEQQARTSAELAALAPRLPAGVQLTAPAAWAGWNGTRPTWAEDVDGCPTLAGRLQAALGGRWSYWQGTLPWGPYGCSWTTEPLPTGTSAPARVVVGVGYEHGSLPGLLTGNDLCAGGVPAPRLAVPTVGSGALLIGCDDATGRGLDLAVPDAGGTGVFFLHSTGGPATTSAQASAALLAVLSAARHAYS